MESFILAIEVGGTYIRTGISDMKGDQDIAYKKMHFVNTGDASHEINQNIIEPINKLIYDHREKTLLGIGISLAANVDRKSGVIKNWPNHPLWNGFPIRDYLKGKFSVPIIIEDDANCGLLGEYASLNTDNIKNLVYICIGTGVGCGLMLNGILYTGENGFAGELGHVCLHSYNTICTCGNVGCLQSIISGPAILKKYNHITEQNYSGMEVVSNKFDPVVKECYEETICALSKSIYNISMLLDVSNFVIGGGVVEIQDTFVQDIETEVNLHLKPFDKRLYITKAKLGEQAGITGAIQLIKNMMHEECSHPIS